MPKIKKDEPKSFIPYSYLQGFIRFVSSNSHKINVISYDDLPWSGDYDHENFYRGEWKEWNRKIKGGSIDASKAHLLIQHDVDTAPERTKEVVLDELKFDVKTNLMVFNRRLERRILNQENRLEYGEYDLDWELYEKLQKESGFVIGYHSNAYEQSLFDIDKAKEIFCKDIEDLSRHVDLRYFSPHGGVRDESGQSNTFLDLPEELRGVIRWVHNKYSPSFNAQYSDGGINGKRDPEARDIRDFVPTLEPGKRYRVLIHPQYYGHDFSVSKRLNEAQWYRDLLYNHSKNGAYDPWESIELSF